MIHLSVIWGLPFLLCLDFWESDSNLRSCWEIGVSAGIAILAMGLMKWDVAQTELCWKKPLMWTQLFWRSSFWLVYSILFRHRQIIELANSKIFLTYARKSLVLLPPLSSVAEISYIKNLAEIFTDSDLWAAIPWSQWNFLDESMVWTGTFQPAWIMVLKVASLQDCIFPELFSLPLSSIYALWRRELHVQEVEFLICHSYSW